MIWFPYGPHPAGGAASHPASAGVGALSEGAEIETLFDSEPIEAWRVWNLWEGPLGPELWSVTHPVAWRPRRAMRAHCVYKYRTKTVNTTAAAATSAQAQHEDQAPARGHSCGIYALMDRGGLKSWGARHMHTPETRKRGRGEFTRVGRVEGLVLLWGRVIPHALGYRAEFAYPKEFFVERDLADSAAWLASAFGVAATLYDPPKPKPPEPLPT